jgi:hypothetical protein
MMAAKAEATDRRVLTVVSGVGPGELCHQVGDKVYQPYKEL